MLFRSISWKQSKFKKVLSRSFNGTIQKTQQGDYTQGKRLQRKRDLSGRANGTLDPWYGCDVFDEMWEYAVNFTFPWCA